MGDPDPSLPGTSSGRTVMLGFVALLGESDPPSIMILSNKLVDSDCLLVVKCIEMHHWLYVFIFFHHGISWPCIVIG